MLPDRVFIQTRLNSDVMPLSEGGYQLWYGCSEMGIETRIFRDYEQIEAEVRRETVVHGGIGNVVRALKALGAPLPSVPDYPEDLLPWLGRRVWTSTLGEIRRQPRTETIFVKSKKQKALDGHLITPEFRSLIYSAGHGDGTEVYVSEVVNFVSEYRCMVLHEELVAARHYKGDFTKAIDFGPVRAAIAAFSTAPVAYALDFGVTDTGETLLVEVNDAFSLGSYGTPSITYTRMVLDRWQQMTECLPPSP